MVALEYVKEDKMSFKILETIAEFMHQISSVFDLRKKYEDAMQYDQKTGILNYQSYMEYLERINEDIHSTFGIFGIHIASLKLQVVLPSPRLLPHIQFEVPYRYELHFLRQIVPAYHGKYR